MFFITPPAEFSSDSDHSTIIVLQVGIQSSKMRYSSLGVTLIFLTFIINSVICEPEDAELPAIPAHDHNDDKKVAEIEQKSSEDKLDNMIRRKRVVKKKKRASNDLWKFIIQRRMENKNL